MAALQRRRIEMLGTGRLIAEICLNTFEKCRERT